MIRFEGFFMDKIEKIVDSKFCFVFVVVKCVEQLMQGVCFWIDIEVIKIVCIVMDEVFDSEVIWDYGLVLEEEVVEEVVLVVVEVDEFDDEVN